MTTLALDCPAPPGAPSPGDNPYCHIWCCDKDTALCGADLSGTDDCDGEDCDICPPCAAADEDDLPCPVPGCTGVS